MLWLDFFFQKIALEILYKIHSKELSKGITGKPYAVSSIKVRDGLLSNVLFFTKLILSILLSKQIPSTLEQVSYIFRPTLPNRAEKKILRDVGDVQWPIFLKNELESPIMLLSRVRPYRKRVVKQLARIEMIENTFFFNLVINLNVY
jgi:hypothetical protein